METSCSCDKIGGICNWTRRTQEKSRASLLIWELQREADAQDKDISNQKCQITGSILSSFPQDTQMSSKNFTQFSVDEITGAKSPSP